MSLEQTQMEATISRLNLRFHGRFETTEEDDTTTTTPSSNPPWSDVLRTVLCGVRDSSSPLSLLEGHEETILKLIYGIVVESWAESVKRTPPAYTVGRIRADAFDPRDFGLLVGDNDEDERRDRNRHGRTMMNVSYHAPTSCSSVGSSVDDRPEIAFTRCGFVRFPPPNNRNVNMMPFVMGDRDSLPDDLKCYIDLISVCPVMEEEMGKVCYLTVQEGFVDQGNTQRRGGLHIEAPGQLCLGAHYFVAGDEHHWGEGVAVSPDELHGGLYFASNVADTTAVWDALVDKKKDPSLVDAHGGIEPLRRFLGRPTLLEANELVWLTDRTPHEALKQTQGGHRQFFRLVTSAISFWFAEHSTPNPLVDLPSHVRVVEGSKFSEHGNK